MVLVDGRPFGRDSSSRAVVKTVQSPYFTIKAVNGNIVGQKTITTIISKATIKKAVRRNFLKRQIINILKKQVNFQKKIVVIVRLGVVGLTKKEFKQELLAATKKIL